MAQSEDIRTLSFVLRKLLVFYRHGVVSAYSFSLVLIIAFVWMFKVLECSYMIRVSCSFLS